MVVQECFQWSQLFLFQAMHLTLKLSFIVIAKVSLLFPELLLLLEGSQLMLSTEM